jgi:hypothetical protein
MKSGGDGDDDDRRIAYMKRGFFSIAHLAVRSRVHSSHSPRENVF